MNIVELKQNEVAGVHGGSGESKFDKAVRTDIKEYALLAGLAVSYHLVVGRLNLLGYGEKQAPALRSVAGVGMVALMYTAVSFGTRLFHRIGQIFS